MSRISHGMATTSESPNGIIPNSGYYAVSSMAAKRNRRLEIIIYLLS
ncbi:MAG: hypothetical protein HY754_12655 [Nitrospirae bacterium]|nr:hypothetical protein [Nitrospirota bacterium]